MWYSQVERSLVLERCKIWSLGTGIDPISIVSFAQKPVCYAGLDMFLGALMMLAIGETAT